MKLLLDTHILLWATRDARELSRAARTLLEDTENQLIFSAVSVWEVAIKYRPGRGDLVPEPGLLRRALLDHGYIELPMNSDHAIALSSLPHIHKDPFDRMLVAQALAEGITFLTADASLAKYPGSIRQV
ncbi:MAG TPA: type II toxin-antitoxin system VapC family toxin [Acidisarcina sp.]